MTHCIHCDSTNVQSRGTREVKNGNIQQRYFCNSCKNWFSLTKQPDPLANRFDTPVYLDDYKRYVITSVVNNSELNADFYAALQNYCVLNSAKLILMPVQGRTYGEELSWAIPPTDMSYGTFRMASKLRVAGNLNISPLIDNPLGGLDVLTKGDSLIVPHPKINMRTVANDVHNLPAILHTTGSVTLPNYPATKTGVKADFTHSMAALVVEIDPSTEMGFHVRILNCDDHNGFYDISGYYGANKFTPLESVLALVAGDTHATNHDLNCADALYYRDDSVAWTLKPATLVTHDLLDFQSGSHHAAKQVFVKYAQMVHGTNDVEKELVDTLNHILDISRHIPNVLVVDSNHNAHLGRWLNEHDPKLDPLNAKIYHQLSYLMLDEIDKTGKIPDAFALWVDSKMGDHSKIKFLSSKQPYFIADVDVSNHGEKGSNGSRGSVAGYAKLAHKMIVGHAHSPSIVNGAWTVGTSSKLKMGYNNGSPSSWMHASAVIYPNGKRQMIFIQDGVWKI